MAPEIGRAAVAGARNRFERCTEALSFNPPIPMDRSTKRTLWATTVGQRRDAILAVLRRPSRIESAPGETEVWTYERFLMVDYTVYRQLYTRSISNYVEVL